MHPAHAPLLLVATLLLAGCSPRAAPEPDPAVAGSATAPSASGPRPDEAHPPPAGPGSPMADVPKAAGIASAGAHVALSGEGLDFVDASTGSIRHMAFGVPIAQVVDAITRLRDAPPRRGTNTECGAGPMDVATWPDGLSVLSQDARFVGWSHNPGQDVDATARLPTTVAGVGLGSTRRELESAYAARIAPSTLGTEFSAGGLYGILASARPDASITALWAGTSCVFR